MRIFTVTNDFTGITAHVCANVGYDYTVEVIDALGDNLEGYRSDSKGDCIEYALQFS